jgi:DNA-directed RNA polymerase specialized sigma24 family protein
MRAGVRQVAPGSPPTRDWNKFWKVYYGTIRRIGRAAGLRGADLNELESDVRLALLKCRPKYHRNSRRGSFRAWLHKIVSLKAIDILRRKKRHPTVSLTNILDDGDEPIDSSADPASLYERSWSAAFV